MSSQMGFARTNHQGAEEEPGQSENDGQNSLQTHRKALYQDLSCKSLSEYPFLEIKESSQLQFLYLQNNFIKSLPDDFFVSLPALRHLDLRQNYLEKIPLSIAGHYALEVLLVQNNCLSSLPCELGQVPRLRKLQFSGNPLTWPSAEVLAKGLVSILSFLRTAFMQQLNSRDIDATTNEEEISQHLEKFNENNSETTKDQSSDFENDVNSQHFSHIYNKSISPFSASCQQNNSQSKFLPKADKNLETLLLQGSSKQLKNRTDSTVHSAELRDIHGTFLNKSTSPNHAQAILNGQSFPLGYKKHSASLSTNKVYKSLLKQLWLNQLKCTLQSQAHILQRQKTFEALRQWREKEKSLHRSISESSWPRYNAPYDLDTNHMKMVTRAGLHQFQSTSLEKKGHSKPNSSSIQVMGLEEKINEILQTFENLKLESAYSTTKLEDIHPSTRRKHLAEEMKRINKLQKAVQALRLSA